MSLFQMVSYAFSRKKSYNMFFLDKSLSHKSFKSCKVVNSGTVLTKSTLDVGSLALRLQAQHQSCVDHVQHGPAKPLG